MASNPNEKEQRTPALASVHKSVLWPRLLIIRYPSLSCKSEKKLFNKKKSETHSDVGICVCFNVLVNVIGGGESNRIAAIVDRVFLLIHSDIIHMHGGGVNEIWADRTEPIGQAQIDEDIL